MYREYLDPEFRDLFDDFVQQSREMQKAIFAERDNSPSRKKWRVQWYDETGDGGERIAYDSDARNAALRNANACKQMAQLCAELLAFAPGLTPREFLRTLGALVAGIDLGVIGFKQLARGGANGLVGAGFRPEYDDGTAGQARHFAGTAAAAALVGEKPAELLAHHLVDPADSIDGRLSTAALEFAHLLIDGDLPLDRAGAWIESHVCDPDFVLETGFSPFDVFSERSADAAALRSRPARMRDGTT